MSDLDIRKHPDYDATLKQIPALRLRPLVGPRDLKEVALVMRPMPELEFPINSAGELLDQIGEGRRLEIVGIESDPVRMIKYMPAYYFPIASAENLVEKMAELVRENRRGFDQKAVTEKVSQKAQHVRFPLADRSALHEAFADTPYFVVAGRKMETRAVIEQLDDTYFPIDSEKDLEQKALRYLKGRPLIEAD